MNQHSFCISLRSLKSILHLQFEHFLLNYTEVVLSSIFSSIHTLVCSLLTNKNKLKIFTLEKKATLFLSLFLASSILFISRFSSRSIDQGEEKTNQGIVPASHFVSCSFSRKTNDKHFSRKFSYFYPVASSVFCFFSLFGLSAFPSSIALRERLTCVSTLVFSFSCQGGDFEHFLYFLLQQALLSAAAERIV